MPTSVASSLRLRNGAEVDVAYEWDKYFPATFDHPEEGGFEGITEVFGMCKLATGATAYVDVTHLISYEDMDFLCAQIGTDYE